MNIEKVKEILSEIHSAPSGIRMGTDADYEFQVKEINTGDPEIDGFLIRCGFWRPDTYTGEYGQGFGRWNHCPKDCTRKAIIMTAYVAYKLVVEHEMMEAFEYAGVKLLDPHKNLRHLAYPKLLQFYQFEYDPEYTGGNYDKIGQFTYVPVRYIDNQKMDPLAAFQKTTGLDPIHVIHYTLDERYDMDHELIENI